MRHARFSTGRLRRDRTSRMGEDRTHDRGDRNDVSDAGPVRVPPARQPRAASKRDAASKPPNLRISPLGSPCQSLKCSLPSAMLSPRGRAPTASYPKRNNYHPRSHSRLKRKAVVLKQNLITRSRDEHLTFGVISKNVCPRWLGVANTITNTLAEHAPYYATLRLVSSFGRAFTQFVCFAGYGGTFALYFIRTKCMFY